ncbi:sodium:solute symporter family protein [Chondrinema litorale]|uniref:sodium:solute symporter family protein n=1 Tax=Chondrinema litorale TaxID=2994555 RepID=UPI0025431FE6|nr:sodium:solute symporter family protein [Chondrinema litorale]UZR92849.1 Na+:solute symporter [Chondrinema litorale]
MELSVVDIIIIVLYLFLTVFIGFYISKKASANLEAYFLGGKSLPWYVLGVSNASGMFDITGTMWLVALCFIYGLKSAWIPWLWPVFNQIFLMVFLSAWLRRSNVMTGAEWIQTRFGSGKGAKLSNIIVIVFALVTVVGYLAYAFQGIGKFAYTFLPKSLTLGESVYQLTPNIYGLIFIGITALYVVKGGMYSVVLTEVVQFLVMTVASITVGIVAMYQVPADVVSQIVPDSWYNLFFGWELDLQWDIAAVNEQIQKDGYSLFSIFFMMMVFKGILVSLAGPAPNYDMQRVLSTKSPTEAAKMSGLVSLVLFMPRYMLIAGIAILGLASVNELGLEPLQNSTTGVADFELVLPHVIKNYIPIGLVGLLLAGLLAAFMSTVAATVNAAPAYLVNDIYKKYINPDAEPKTYVKMSYLSTIVVLIIGVGFGFATDSINQVTQWIVNALYGGYAVSNLLKWFWWRLNGYGYFWGMLAGVLASLFLPILPFVDVSFIPLPEDLARFPLMFVLSAVGCIVGSYFTKPQADDELIEFYKRVRPWGFWEPIRQKLLEREPNFKINTSFRRDMVNILIGIVWQVSLVVFPIYLVVRENYLALIAFGVAAITTWLLKINWYDKLED